MMKGNELKKKSKMIPLKIVSSKQKILSVKSRILSELSEEEKKEILSSLYFIARENLGNITLEYLEKRMESYKIITLIQSQEEKELMGFSFSQIYFLSFLKIPIFHCGFTLLSRSFRGKGISIILCASLYNLLLEKKMVSRFLLFFAGILFTAKCSSPVSFLKIKNFTRYFSWPQIKDEDRLSWFSRTKPSVFLSRFLSYRLSEQKVDDFILREINSGEDYQPDEEEYSFKSKEDQKVVRFFETHIMPHNELITIAWFHPVFLWFHRRDYVHSR